MRNEIFTKTITLHVDNKKLPPLTIQEADEYLIKVAAKLNPQEKMSVSVDITFTDGFILSETISISKADALINNLIRYHIIGLIRYKAGLLIPNITNQQDYLNNLHDIDTEHYKKIYTKYSLFYSVKKYSNKSKTTDRLTKLKNKYIKLKDKELTKRQIVSTNINMYDGIIDGIDITTDQAVFIAKYTKEIEQLTPYAERYHYLKGVLQGISLTSETNSCGKPDTIDVDTSPAV